MRYSACDKAEIKGSKARGEKPQSIWPKSLSIVSDCVAAALCLGCAASLPTESEIQTEVFGKVQPFLSTRKTRLAPWRVRYAVAGTGEKTILLIHGFPETLQTWRLLTPMLSARFRVVAIDLLGSGESSRPDVDYTPADYVRFLDRFIEKMDLRKVTLVGTDTGVLIAVSFALAFPERTDKLILLSGSPFASDADAWQVRAMSRRVIGEVALYNPFTRVVLKNALEDGYSAPKRLSKEIFDEYTQSAMGRGGRRAALRTIRSFSKPRTESTLKEKTRTLSKETLIVYGDRDPFFPVNAGRRLANHIPGAVFSVLDNTGHFIQEERPNELSRMIAAFIENDTPKNKDR
jgi:pimeloyl-ACP methyl ester carboxylesterase